MRLIYICMLLFSLNDIEAIDHFMYVSDFSCNTVAYLCNRRGALWVQMFPAVRTQWTTPLTL